MSDKVEITVLESLSVEEESERLRLERKVEKAFYEAGLSLKILKERKLYRSTHSNFRDYCKERFGFKKSAVYYLISAVDIVDNLKKCPPLVDTFPTSERQCRPLKSLKPKQQQEAWKMAVEKAGGKVPTAKIVREVVNQIEPQKTQAERIPVESNSDRLSLKTEYVPIDKAQIGQNVRVKSYHPLFPLQSGVIVQIPNNKNAIVELENNSRELVDIRDLEIQVLVENNGSVKTPAEGPNRIPGAGLDWYVRVDEPTFKALDSYAREHGIPTLGIAITRLLEQVEVKDRQS